MYSKQQQHAHGNTDGIEAVYKQQPETPPAPGTYSSTYEVSKHKLPMAVAVPIDSTSSYQHPSGVLPVDDSNNRQHHHWLLSWVLRVPVLLLFHALNFALAVPAFILVVTLGSLSVGLLPLCCLGVLVFQLLAGITQYLVVLDVMLANLVTPVIDSREVLCVDPRITSGFTARDRDGCVSRVTFVSSRTIGAMAYLMTIKFILGILSCLVVALLIGSPATAIEFASDTPKTQFAGLTYADHPVAYVFTTIAMMLLGLVLLSPMATLSWRLTKVACAEKTHRDGEYEA